MPLVGKATLAAGDVSPAISPPARRITSGTGQQEALWQALVEGNSHVLAEARAGCGKSSSCREAMFRMLEHRPGQAIRYTVFNNANADEFRPQCPPGVEVETSHKFGLRALGRAFRSRVEKLKSYIILDDTPAGRNLPRYLRKSVALLVGQAKNQCLDPEQDKGLELELERLLEHYNINAYGRPGLIVGWAVDVLKRSRQWVELCDFDDMLWLPALHQLDFPECDALFLDECQDFNPVQHRLVPLMAKSGRIIAVGDRHQAINAFRGADMDSIPNLQGLLQQTERGLTRYPLTITFRCPRSHVELANQLVADLMAHESAPEGEILWDRDLGEMIAECVPGDLVICPTNAPVVKGCLRLIANRRPAYVRGRKVGEQLVGILKGIGACKTVAECARGVENWRARELNRLSQLDGVEDVMESVNDRAEGLQAVLESCASPADAEPVIDRLFSDERQGNSVTFSTVHRAKGDEAKTVWFINAPMREPKREWEARQQRNLRYVALTRSKHSLRFVKLRDEPRPGRRDF
jgi:superfamily I DNA/RNA helicase